MDLLRNKFSNSIQEDLPEGHFSRFEAKLNSKLHSSSEKKTLYISIYAIAAVFIAALLLSFLYQKPDTKTINVLILAQESSELIETEKYFQYQIQEKLNQIDALVDKIEQKKIKKDLLGFDSELDNLKEDYKQAPGDQRVVNAVINTYMMKIEAIDNIINIVHKYI
ncbi:MAG: hypothetical protein JXA77_11395 [Bacteroidales bacterium]|nr:hypothetical protein [Bacteroidales bacterium]MBN2817441.1 hypothetical protein [Bacteroidales bacterium]